VLVISLRWELFIARLPVVVVVVDKDEMIHSSLPVATVPHAVLTFTRILHTDTRFFYL